VKREKEFRESEVFFPTSKWEGMQRVRERERVRESEKERERERERAR
jgi:hypothetical protein